MDMAARFSDGIDPSLPVGGAPLLEPFQDERIDGDGVAADINRPDRFRELGVKARAARVLGDEGVEDMNDDLAADQIVAQNFADGGIAVSRIALKAPVVVDAGQGQAAQTAVDADIRIVGQDRDVDDLGA